METPGLPPILKRVGNYGNQPHIGSSTTRAEIIEPDIPANTRTPTWIWFMAGCGVCLFLLLPFFGMAIFRVFAQAQPKARQSVCLNNLKVQANCLLMYEQDYDEVLPPSNTWMDHLNPYVPKNYDKGSDDADYFRCPNLEVSIGKRAGYAFNNNLGGKSVSNATQPSRVPMIYDSTTMTGNVADAFTSLPFPGRHNRGNNIGFGDGHVRWMGNGSTSTLPRTLTKPDM